LAIFVLASAGCEDSKGIWHWHWMALNGDGKKMMKEGHHTIIHPICLFIGGCRRRLSLIAVGFLLGYWHCQVPISAAAFGAWWIIQRICGHKSVCEKAILFKEQLEW
jgi:hypothetical protein